jgi:(R,R)-butanediol dehydrogenase/meso-butanediol dehydrogenase/diacetyl reductase
MKAAVFTGQSKFEVRDVPMPIISDDEVLLKVRACGVCGTDLNFFKNGFPWKPDPIFGHEFCGEIVELGKNVKGWEKGTRVTIDPYIHCFECFHCKQHHYNRCDVYNVTGITVDGAFAEYTKVFPYQMIRIPDSMPDEVGTLFQPLACSLSAVRLGNVQINDTVVVVGAGIIGIGCILWAKAAGAARIVAVETSDARIGNVREKELADFTINPLKTDVVEEIKKITGGLGAPVIIECSGNAIAMEKAVEYAQKGGTIVAYGSAHEPNKVDWLKITMKDLTIRGGLSAGSPGGYEFSVKAWEDGVLDTGSIDIVKASIDDIVPIFEASARGEIVKAVFMFN